MKHRILDVLWWTGMVILVAIIVVEAIHIYNVGMW
jgi:hypothetical protein